MKKLFLLAILLCVGVFSFSEKSFAQQTTKEVVASSYQDVSFGVGMYMNTSDEALQRATVYSLDFAQFYHHNIGFRTGLTYIDQLGRDVAMVGVPLHFAWRSGIDRRTKEEKLGAAAYSFVGSGGDVTPALMNLIPIRIELRGGITPMFATSMGGITRGWSSSGGDFAEELSVKNNFALSADIAARLSFRVWRINIFFEPQYRYWLTDNFKYQLTNDSGAHSPEISRSYMSLQLGLNFIL